MRNKNEGGQVALIVLLVAAVVMTVGVSLSKKATVDTKLDINEELAKKAFDAAESGVDNYLGTGSTRYVSSDSQTGADIMIKNVGNGSTVNFNQFVLTNQSVFYWLVGHDSDGNVDYGTYYSGNSLKLCIQNSFNEALKLDYFYRDPTNNYVVKRFGYNVTTDAVSGFSNLPVLIQAGCDTNFREVSLPGVVLGGGAVPLLISIKPVGMGTKMYLVGDGPLFPIQGETISSQGKAGEVSTSREVSRQIGVLRLYDVSPFLVDSVVGWGNVLSN